MKKALLFALLLSPQVFAAETFRHAPVAMVHRQSPISASDRETARAKGAKLFAAHCASCHGSNAMGAGNVPALARGPAQNASPGELFWFITTGAKESGMPPAPLTKRERWEVVTYVQSLGQKPIEAVEAKTTFAENKSPPPPAPFTDYRFEQPGKTHKISAQDLPSPQPETSVGNAPQVLPRPAGAWPKVPQGFRVQLFASGLENPRLLRTAPNGDIFLSESDPGKIKILHGVKADGGVEKVEVFATGLKRPYGLQFYPPGPDPQWLYVGNTDSVVRFPYKNGDLRATGGPEKVADLPSLTRGHWTRDLQFSPKGDKLFVGVGSVSNVDDPDTSPDEKNRADILVMSPKGEDIQVYASGIRNAGGGLTLQPGTGELWCSVNERDTLGDNLVPDYITHVVAGGFYGWPWWYIGSHQDPRHKGKHPELKDKTIVPDVLLQPHHASLQLVFYDGKEFPKEYRGDIFATQHGSWNRSVRTGYELIRVPFHGKTRPSGEYEDFMTGFVVDNGHVWGRPVGVTVAPDGALLVSDDGSNSVWRIKRNGEAER